MMATACTKSEPYKFERSGIVSVKGTKSLISPVEFNVPIDAKHTDELLDGLEALCVKEIEPWDVYPGGYDYAFKINYEDGSCVSVIILGDCDHENCEEHNFIKIDGRHFVLGDYKPSDFLKYFE